MSALTPITDMRRRVRHVRSVPIADIAQAHVETGKQTLPTGEQTRVVAIPVEQVENLFNRVIRPAPGHLVFCSLITVIWPFTRSASNFTLSPTLSPLSISGSRTRNTMLIASMSRFLIGPCLIVILPAVASILVTCPSTAAVWAFTIGGIPAATNAMQQARSNFTLRMVFLLQAK